MTPHVTHMPMIVRENVTMSENSNTPNLVPYTKIRAIMKPHINSCRAVLAPVYDNMVLKRPDTLGEPRSSLMNVSDLNFRLRFKSRNEWACPDLNRSQWLPKPQGYQATPQAHNLP